MSTFKRALRPFSKTLDREVEVKAPAPVVARARPPRRLARHVKAYRPQDVLGSTSKTTNPQRSDYNPDKAVAEGLQASVWVWRCCSLIAQAAASVPWKVKQQVAIDRWEPAPSSRFQKLIDKPNPSWSRNRFMQETVYSLLLAGEAYQSKLRSKVLGNSQSVTDHEGKPVGIPHELWVLPPDRLAPIPGGTNRPLVVGYEARDAKKPKPQRVPASEIMQPMFVNPADPYHGLSPLEAARRDIDTDVAAADWQKHTFANRAVPDGVFKVNEYVEVDGDEEGDEDSGWAATKKALQEAYFGAKNARTPMMLGQDIDWIPIAQSMIDVDFQGGRKATKENICAAFGVPVILAGAIEGATYANFSASELWLWKATVLPILDMIRDVLNTQLAPEFGPGWRVDYDTANVSALLPLYLERLKAAKDLFAMGVPVSEINERLELGINEFEGWEVGKVPANLVDVADFANSLGDI